MKACISLITLVILLAGRVPAADQLLNLPDEPSTYRFLPALKVWPANPGEAHLCWWENDATAAVSVTIDDNNVHEHSWWKSQGERLGMRFTWFVITSRCSDSDWDSFRDLQANGHDVQSHTVNHVGSSGVSDATYATEYANSISAIESEIPGYRCLTLAYPNGIGSVSEAAKVYVGARGVYGRPNMVGKTWYMNTNSMHFSDEYVTAVAVRGGGELLLWRGWMSIHIHYLNEDGGPTVIQGHLDHIASYGDEIWVGLWKDVVRYGQSRDTHTLTVNSVSSSEIKYTLSDRMHDDYFDYPLTVKVRVDNSWLGVTATQNGSACEVTEVTEGDKNYVLIQTVPDGGEVTVTPTSTAITLDRKALSVPVSSGSSLLYDMLGRRAGGAQTGIYLTVPAENGTPRKIMLVQ